MEIELKESEELLASIKEDLEKEEDLKSRASIIKKNIKEEKRIGEHVFTE